VQAAQAPACETSQGWSGMQVLCELHNQSIIMKAAPERQHIKHVCTSPGGWPQEAGHTFRHEVAQSDLRHGPTATQLADELHELEHRADFVRLCAAALLHILPWRAGVLDLSSVATRPALT